MATVTVSQHQRIVLNVNWDGYIAIGEVLRDQPVRMTYRRGRLEIMTLSHEHEWLKKLMARLLEQLTLELNVEVHSGGSTTFRDEEIEAGMEPDECYWIEQAELMAGKATFDPDSDPPPDLALEIEISRNVLNRLAIYSGLGIPEVWRFDGQTVRVLLLREDGEYETSATSKAFPMVPVAEFARFLELRHTMGEQLFFASFRPGFESSRPQAGASRNGNLVRRSNPQRLTFLQHAERLESEAAISGAEKGTGPDHRSRPRQRR